MPTATLQSESNPTNNSLSQSQHGHPQNLLVHTNRTGQTRDEFFNTRAETTTGHLTPTEEHSPTRSRISSTSLPFPVTSFPQSHHHSVFDDLRDLFLAISHNISTSVSLRRVYLYFLLLLPRHYFSRVAGIFCALDIDMAEIRRDALSSAAYEDNGSDILEAAPSHSIQSQKEDLQNAWEEFIGTLTREWETLNIVSALLLSAILTVLQIETASSYPLTQFSAFFSLICALMSLLYGCMYIIRFGGLRKTLTWALEWASEAQQTRTPIFWNTWVMLAMPAVWLCWYS
ncbi:hypothetical protein BDQ12DRAFT_123232 [Crucibulum laeve]|uniref:Uncharacterized protein n=1 Tax=Crucibulum laeve TaxID=68775 RepID=A0A5C3LY35_9AGAR|nr:hypothetical protein BDQ12DRAFT_123232 [Crucibulum laeve]